jgi:integrase/recombinase XerD
MSRVSFELRESRWARDLGTYAPAIQAFADHLAGLDYRADTVMRLASAARHFCVWLRLSKVAPGEISDEVVARFTRHRCRCLGRQRSAPRIAINFERRVRQFVRFLAKDPAERPRNAQADDPRIEAYRTWMRLHRGLSENTICDHERVLRRTLPLLGHDSTRYDAHLVREAVLEISRRHARSSVKNAASVLRCYLRFLASRKECRAGLDQAVPTMAAWRLSSLPRYLPAEKVEALIASCNRPTPAGIRDRAIILLLARLGLRAGDVLHLRIDDIEWDQGTLRVRGKGRIEIRLPLPQDVGDALLNYLNGARPNVVSDRVFLRSLPPFRPFACHAVISKIVDIELARAGITDAPSRGAHMLRHSAATAMLRAGATLETIGTVLRHRSIDTTAH